MECTTYISSHFSCSIRNFYSYTVPVIFYVSNAYAMICFAKLASKWPELMQSWEDVERNLLTLRKPTINKGRLAYKIKIISAVVMGLSLAEHLLSITTEFTKHQTCRSIEDPMKKLIVSQLPHVFVCTNYSAIKGLIAKAVSVLATFMWSYTDLFLMIVSVGLSSLFKQINANLNLNKHKVSNNEKRNSLIDAPHCLPVCI